MYMVCAIVWKYTIVLHFIKSVVGRLRRPREERTQLVAGRLKWRQIGGTKQGQRKGKRRRERSVH